MVVVEPLLDEFKVFVPVLNGNVKVTPNPDFHTCWVGGDVRFPCGIPGWKGDTYTVRRPKSYIGEMKKVLRLKENDGPVMISVVVPFVDAVSMAPTLQ